jgi:hypothetical protein
MRWGRFNNGVQVGITLTCAVWHGHSVHRVDCEEVGSVMVVVDVRLSCECPSET